MRKLVCFIAVSVLALATFVWMKWPEITYTPQGFAFHYQDIGVTVNILECGKQIGPRPCASDKWDALYKSELTFLTIYPKVLWLRLT